MCASKVAKRGIELCRLFLLKRLVANLKFREGFRRASAITAAASANACSNKLLPRASAATFFEYFLQYWFREHSASFREACGSRICWFWSQIWTLDDLRRSTITFGISFGHICKSREGLVVLQISKFPHVDMWPVPWMRTLPLPRSFRGSSAELPRISYNKMDVSFNMQFLYFLKGQLLIARIFECKNQISREWIIWRKWLYSICFRELPKKNTKNLPRASATAVRYHFPSFMTQSFISLCRK